MKLMKKLMALLLVGVMTLGVMTSSMAATTGDGSITVENAKKDQDYKLYKLLDLESFNKTNKTYSYTVNSDFKAFVEQTNIRGKYLTLTTKGKSTYAEWVEGASAKDFAKLAIEWAKENKITATASKTAEADGTYTFENLPLGYYLLDTSVGSLCSLTTTDKSVTVKDKNEYSTVDKKVKEESNSDFGKSNTAQIGDEVEFKAEITVGEGAENLVLHDKMDASLKFDSKSVAVKIGDNTVDAANYELKVPGTEQTDACTFDVEFKNSYISTLNKGTILNVTYKAVLLSTATTAEKDQDGVQKSNDNTAWLSFGDKLTSSTSTTKTYTYQFGLVKTDDQGKVITGAEFYLYDSNENGNIVKLVQVSANEDTSTYVYRVATKDDNLAQDDNGAIVKAGKTTIIGVDAKLYYLNEEKAPEGYNKLDARVPVDMTGKANNDCVYDLDNGDYIKGGIKVVNKAGTILPTTGGIGTLLIYVLGAILVVGAGVYMARRRSKEQVEE